MYVQNVPLKDAAKELAINYSTAKTILRIFRIEKRIEKKNADEERVLKQLIYDFKKDKQVESMDSAEVAPEIVTNSNVTPLENSTSLYSPVITFRGLIGKMQNNLGPNYLANLAKKNLPQQNFFQKNAGLDSLSNLDLDHLEQKINILDNDHERVFLFQQILALYHSNIRTFSEQILTNQLLLSRLMKTADGLSRESNFNLNGKIFNKIKILKFN